jgi:histidine triad (HIT) family protein
METQQCVFCQIVNGEIPATFEHKGESVVAFIDIQPKAPTHILIVPKKHIEHFAAIEPEDTPVLAEMLKISQDLIARHDLVSKGYRIVMNGGPAALVPHLHMHLLGGIEAHREV